MNVWSVRTYDNAGSWETLWIIKESGNANLKGTLSATDIDLSAPSAIYGLSHNSFADYVPNEHLPGIDEDDMHSDSNTKVPTQQSVKAYVDATMGFSFAEVAALGTL